MTRPRAALVAIGLLAASGALAGCGDDPSVEGAYQEGPASASIVPPEATAPEAAVGHVAFERFDGTQGSFAEFAGRPLVVNFFARWCAPCVRELPDIEEVHQALGDDVTFVGVSVNERPEDALELVEATGVSFDVVRDPRGEALRALGGSAMPTTALVDAEGRVVDVRSLPYEAEELEARVRQELLS